MDSSYIMPFIQSIQNVFETMIQLPVQVGKPTLKETGAPIVRYLGHHRHVGRCRRVGRAQLPQATAERKGRGPLHGMEMTQHARRLPDAIGELVNMISGGAKAKFTGKQVSITCPSVVIGSEHIVVGRKDVSLRHPAVLL